MRPVIVAAALVMVPAVAAAGVLDITGSYGNEAGCRYLKTQEYNDETMVILTPDEYQTYVTFCEFVDMKKTRGGARVLTSVCGHEGEGYETIEFMRVVPAPDNDRRFEIFNASGDSWGTVEACR